jgi:hypothetical protein
MAKFTENLWNDLAQEHGAALAQATRPGPGRAGRPRVIAGSTLALAAAGTALGLGLTSTSGSTPAGGTAAGSIRKVVTDAYTITEMSNGSVLVQVNQTESIVAADAKLSSMGIQEKVSVFPKPGAATVSGPVTCAPVGGAPKRPQVQVLLGTNGTEVIAGGNTGAGAWHLGSCVVFPTSDKGNSGPGNTSNGGAGG